jgi:hypothetical protein
LIVLAVTEGVQGLGVVDHFDLVDAFPHTFVARERASLIPRRALSGETINLLRRLRLVD